MVQSEIRQISLQRVVQQRPLYTPSALGFSTLLKIRTQTRYRFFLLNYLSTSIRSYLTVLSYTLYMHIVHNISRGDNVGIGFFKVWREPESTISGVFLYAENDSDKISDRLGTLKGRF